MKAEIITIGDEILIGQILNTNSKWISKKLTEIGVRVYQITSIPDDKKHILNAITTANKNTDIVIITGGLGPTKDDITKHTLSKYFNEKLVRNQEIETHIISLFEKIKYQYTDLDLLQAYLPNKATILKNHLGTASGMWFKKNDTVFVSLPGVPNEMKALMKYSVIPKIENTFKLPFIVNKTITTYGMGESKIAKLLKDFESNLPNNIKLAYLPAYGKTRLRLSGFDNNKIKLQETFNLQLETLTKLVQSILINAHGDENIEISVGKQLTKNKHTLATAESCTGGAIAKLITSIPGSSNYFKGSIISYHVNIKMKFLNIPKNIIAKHSVVSKEVAKAMAESIKKQFKTDFSIATTGNAGPTTDKTDKTVGVVFIAIATPTETIVKEYNFGQPRERVIEKATVKSLELLLREIK